MDAEAYRCCECDVPTGREHLPTCSYYPSDGDGDTPLTASPADLPEQVREDLARMRDCVSEAQYERSRIIGATGADGEYVEDREAVDRLIAAFTALQAENAELNRHLTQRNAELAREHDKTNAEWRRANLAEEENERLRSIVRTFIEEFGNPDSSVVLAARQEVGDE